MVLCAGVFVLSTMSTSCSAELAQPPADAPPADSLVPDVEGLTLREAYLRLREHGLRLVVDEDLGTPHYRESLMKSAGGTDLVFPEPYVGAVVPSPGSPKPQDGLITVSEVDSAPM